MKTLAAAILGGLLLASPAHAASSLEKTLANRAAAINASAPNDRGGGIILDGAEADGNILTFFYHFDHAIPDDPLGLRQRAMTEGLCKDKTVQHVYVNGGTIKMIWRHKDGTIAHMLLANERRCNPAYSWGPGTY
jgi:hypothetical protein